MLTLARQFLRDFVWLALGYYVVLQVALVAAVLYWPDFRENIPAISKLIPIDAIRSMVEAIEKEGYWAYFALQQFFKGANLFGLAAAAIFGTGIVAREADNRTAEFLLSRPVSRSRILLVRWTLGALLVSLPVFLSSVGGMLLSPVVDEPMPAFGAIVRASLYLSLFLSMLFTVTVWLSAHFEHQLRAGVVLVGLGLLQFALYLVKGVGDFTLFKLVDSQALLPLAEGGFPWIQAGCMVLVTGIFLALALRKFARRDF